MFIGVAAFACAVYIIATSMGGMNIGSAMSSVILMVFAVMTVVSTSSKLFSGLIKLLTLAAIAVVVLDRLGYINIISLLNV